MSTSEAENIRTRAENTSQVAAIMEIAAQLSILNSNMGIILRHLGDIAQKP